MTSPRGSLIRVWRRAFNCARSQLWQPGRGAGIATRWGSGRRGRTGLEVHGEWERVESNHRPAAHQTAAPPLRHAPAGSVLVGKGGVAPPPLAHETGVLLVELLPGGWSTGLEPTPPGSQPGALPFELRPQCPARDSNAQPLASQANARPSSCQGIWVNPWGDAAATQPVTGRNYVGQVWRDAPRIHRFGGPGSPPFRCDHSAVVNVPRVARRPVHAKFRSAATKKPPSSGRLRRYWW